MGIYTTQVQAFSRLVWVIRIEPVSFRLYSAVAFARTGGPRPGLGTDLFYAAFYTDIIIDGVPGAVYG
jgi:hypothetical protein